MVVADYLIERKKAGQFRTFWADLRGAGFTVRQRGSSGEPLLGARSEGRATPGRRRRIRDMSRKGFAKWMIAGFIPTQVKERGNIANVYKALDWFLGGAYAAEIAGLRGLRHGASRSRPRLCGGEQLDRRPGSGHPTTTSTRSRSSSRTRSGGIRAFPDTSRRSSARWIGSATPSANHGTVTSPRRLTARRGVFFWRRFSPYRSWSDPRPSLPPRLDGLDHRVDVSDELPNHRLVGRREADVNRIGTGERVGQPAPFF